MTVLDQFRLDGKLAVVTGATRGLGQAMALGLAEAGANIFVAGSSIFEAEDYQNAMLELKSEAEQSRTSKCG